MPEDLKLPARQSGCCLSECLHEIRSSRVLLHRKSQHGRTCPQNNYGRIFKTNACPDAYSYAYDDATSTFTCSSASGKASGYIISFCG
ncbi:hypothetical protein BV898_03925 [Hypsibius exemplaris]|uniref:Uncharacterized protein n=1 Tax=Hypsibius exemplaris TaxID=2072580 RepID=A0A1W0X3U8_HYPEX|nr:hypothetical protein BV898_03925 [Hypsibius exemplaris]